jgi:hypothetical protein
MRGERAVAGEAAVVSPAISATLLLGIADNARDACLRPVMVLAEKQNLVVLQHVWSMTKIRQRSFQADPEDV